MQILLSGVGFKAFPCNYFTHRPIDGALQLREEFGIKPEQIDRYLNWPLGTATRLARRRQLPHYQLPDGSIRLRKDEVDALVRRIPLQEQQGVARG